MSPIKIKLNRDLTQTFESDDSKVEKLNSGRIQTVEISKAKLSPSRKDTDETPQLPTSRKNTDELPIPNLPKSRKNTEEYPDTEASNDNDFFEEKRQRGFTMDPSLMRNNQLNSQSSQHMDRKKLAAALGA